MACEAAAMRANLPGSDFVAAWNQGTGWDLDQTVAVLSRGRGPRRRPAPSRTDT